MSDDYKPHEFKSDDRGWNSLSTDTTSHIDLNGRAGSNSAFGWNPLSLGANSDAWSAPRFDVPSPFAPDPWTPAPWKEK